MITRTTTRNATILVSNDSRIHVHVEHYKGAKYPTKNQKRKLLKIFEQAAKCNGHKSFLLPKHLGINLNLWPHNILGFYSECGTVELHIIDGEYHIQ